jgi:hypothetical protein
VFHDLAVMDAENIHHGLPAITVTICRMDVKKDGIAVNRRADDLPFRIWVVFEKTTEERNNRLLTISHIRVMLDIIIRNNARRIHVMLVEKIVIESNHESAICLFVHQVTRHSRRGRRGRGRKGG